MVERGLPKSIGGDGTYDRRNAELRRFAAVGSLKTTDPTLSDAIFLHQHDGWKPDDLGYPRADAILIDLMRLLAAHEAATAAARSK